MRGSFVLTPVALLLATLVIATLLISACGEPPTAYEAGPVGTTPFPTPYPPPQTQPQEGSTPTPGPHTTALAPIDLGSLLPCVDITVPIHYDRCTPTPSDEERAAVAAMGLSDKIGFELQRAIYVAEQQGFPWRPADIWIHYDPAIITLTETVALAEGYGIRVTHRSAKYRSISGDAPLDVIPQLAAEPGIVDIGLVAGDHYGWPRWPTPGGPTPVPITPRWDGSP